jgi:hypothetical protein
MKTIELLKDHKHRSNNWKKGDNPTVGSTLAAQLLKDKIARIANEQAPVEQFKPAEAKEE